MRKITENACNAFWNGRAFSEGNTTVSVGDTDIIMYLHGNAIAKRSGDTLSINHCGWETSTTRERLNGVFNSNPDYQYNKVWIGNFQMIFNDKPLCRGWWKVDRMV